MARINEAMITEPIIPPAESGDGGDINGPAIPEPDEDLD